MTKERETSRWRYALADYKDAEALHFQALAAALPLTTAEDPAVRSDAVLLQSRALDGLGRVPPRSREKNAVRCARIIPKGSALGFLSQFAGE